MPGLNPKILGVPVMPPSDVAREYAYGYDAGKKAGAAIAVGKLFRGGMGYADMLAGSNTACRATPCWRGALAGYMDGLPKEAAQGIVVDTKGIIVRIGR